MTTADIFGTGGLGGLIGAGANLAGSIGSLFGSDGGNKNNNPNVNRPFEDPFSTPDYAMGGGTLVRSASNPYLANLAKINALYGNQLGALNAFSTGTLAPLQASIQPGYGNLTQAMVQAAQNKGAQTYGNLRDQLAQRNILGASFAQNQLSGQQTQNLQDENLARGQAFQQEMQAQLGLNQNQIDVLNQQLANANAQAAQQQADAKQRLAELGLSMDFLKSVKQTSDATSQAYNLAQLHNGLGTTATGGGTTGGGTTGGTTTGFAGLPVPGKDDHKWTKIYNQFLASGDAAGYRAYLQSRGLI